MNLVLNEICTYVEPEGTVVLEYKKKKKKAEDL